MARYFVEQARHDVDHLLRKHTNLLATVHRTSHTSENKHREQRGFLTTVFDGVADGLRKTASTRRAAHCATQNSKPAARGAVGAAAHCVEHLASAKGHCAAARNRGNGARAPSVHHGRDDELGSVKRSRGWRPWTGRVLLLGAMDMDLAEVGPRSFCATKGKNRGEGTLCRAP
jgi:hypothetical protein